MSYSPNTKEIFSFHLVTMPVLNGMRFLLSPIQKKNVVGLNHSESFIIMNLGEPILSVPRYNLNNFASFAWWSDEASLDEFLSQPSNHFFNNGWHVRMRLYRRWGEIAEIKTAHVEPTFAQPTEPVVAVTLARLKLSQTRRFIQWGKPVESQVRDHKGQVLALAAIRPLNTFTTFSIWKNESEMLGMVSGDRHELAMRERARKDFHHEFSTMRFAPFKEVGSWSGKSGYT